MIKPRLFYSYFFNRWPQLGLVIRDSPTRLYSNTPKVKAWSSMARLSVFGLEQGLSIQYAVNQLSLLRPLGLFGPICLCGPK